MDPTRSSGEGSGNSCGEIADSLQFQEIHSLMRENQSGPQNGSSFTALLGLPANQAMELLHQPDSGHSQAISSPAAADIWRLQEREQKPLDGFPFSCFPTFPSNPDLVERAARFSVFAAEDSPQTTSSGRSNSGVYLSKAVKTEPADSDSNPNSSPGSKPQQRPAKRKEQEKSSKAKGSAKRAKSSVDDGVPKPAEENRGGDEKEKLPYVHVRARRGQATDSHSLAERARREKINARMKLLQELVPGCNKISGTAQVLDEIINHVQSLQRQVEFLSMRLAAVNPRIDFSGLDSFLAASGRMQEANVGCAPGLEQPSLWPDAQRQQQIWLADLLPTSHSYSSSPPPQPPPPPLWGRDDAEHHGLVPPGNSLFGFDSLNSVPLHANPLKQEI